MKPSILLMPFGCGEEGLQVPLVHYGIVPDNDPLILYYADAMALVEVSQEDEIAQVIAGYSKEREKVSFSISSETSRALPDNSSSVIFKEYLITYESTNPQPVYAITTGNLYLLQDDNHYEDILSGAKPDTGELILVLKPHDYLRVYEWGKIIPGHVLTIEECAYLNVELAGDEEIISIIKRSVPKRLFEAHYKEKTGNDWPGTGNWELEYLKLFKEYPDVNLNVKGGDVIAYTQANPVLLSDQHLRMFYKIGGRWDGHEEELKTFLRFFQRSICLTGHPVIARALDLTPEECTVDTLPYLDEVLLKREKTSLVNDFKENSGLPEPLYHPLALGADGNPNTIMVPVPSEYSMFPTPELRPDQLLTKFKLHNPLELPLELQGVLPEGLSITPLSFSAAEPLIVIEAGASFDPSIKETSIDLLFNGKVLQSYKLLFLPFRIIQIKFWKVTDNNSAHTTVMDETRLLEVIKIANDILGRQTNVFIVPLQESNVLLKEFHYDGDLGDTIGLSNLENITGSVFNNVHEKKDIHVFFVWYSKDETSGYNGITHQVSDHYRITINTSGVNVDNVRMATTLLHELGHWFSGTFLGDTRQCEGGLNPFTHRQQEFDACPGDWQFYDNLMMPSIGYFISYDQAKVFNDFALQVLPTP